MSWAYCCLSSKHLHSNNVSITKFPYAAPSGDADVPVTYMFDLKLCQPTGAEQMKGAMLVHTLQATLMQPG